jgi:hypothetical protein
MSYDFIKIKNDNELYNRISNLMNRWKIGPDDAVKLIISVETSQDIYINSLVKKYIFLYRIRKAKNKIKNDILILKKYEEF